MADVNTAPPRSGDEKTPPATTEFRPAEPLKNAGVDFRLEDRDSGAAGSGALVQAKHAAQENLAGFGQQASDKARELAEAGKEKVGGVLDQLATMLTDVAGQVDEKVGAQFGDYARTAASSVQEFGDTIRRKNVDEFAEDVRGYVGKSPAVALGISAGLGFALARLVHAGLDQRA